MIFSIVLFITAATLVLPDLRRRPERYDSSLYGPAHSHGKGANWR